MTEWLEGGTIITKKQTIKLAALHLFAEQGYHQTAVQQIASKAQISKGAFYHHFESKDQLFIELIKDHYQGLLNKTQPIPDQQLLNSQDILALRISTELEQIKHDRCFLPILLKEIAFETDEKIAKIMKEFRWKLTCQHHSYLYEAYGERIHSLRWDLTIIFEGILKEYISLIVMEHIDIPSQKLAHFIATKMETLIHDDNKQAPILTSDMLATDTQARTFQLKEQAHASIIELKQLAHAIDIDHTEATKIKQAVDHLEQLLLQNKNEHYLLEALVAYLKKYPALKKQMGTLEKIIVKMG